MKRVLIFSLSYYPYVGGAEVAIKEITDRLGDEFDCHLIACRYDTALPATERVGSVTVHRIGPGKRGMTIEESFRPIVYLAKILYVPLATWKAYRLHRQHRFDLFWAMMSYMVFPIALLRLVGVRVPYVLTLQEGDPFERQFGRKRIRVVLPLLKYGFRHATAVQAISNYLLTWARHGGFTGDGQVIPNAVDTARFTRIFTKDEIRAEQQKLGKKDGEVFLVTTSRLVRKNAVDEVIRALPYMRPGVVFLVAGVGPEEKSLHSLTAELQVTDRVRFLGEVSQEGIPALLAASDIFIRPSRSEGLGISFIEAMAAGLPIVATQEGGIADFLFDRLRNPGVATTGWAVDVDSPEQIAGAVEDILTHPDNTAQVVRNALELAIKEYGWELIAERMRSLFVDSMHALTAVHETGEAGIPRSGIRLLIATPLYPPESGGPATYAKLLEDGLGRSDIQVAVLKFSDVRRYPKVMRHMLYFLRTLRAAKNTDLILALDPVSTGFPAAVAAHLRGKPFVVKIVGDYAWEQGTQRFGVRESLDDFVRLGRVSFPVAVLRSVQTHVASHADLVIVPSEYLKGIVMTWGIPEAKIQVIYNAIAPSEGGTVPEAVRNLTHPRITSIGRLVPWKGVHGLIDAVAVLRDTFPEATLTVVGDGPDRDKLESYARARLGSACVFTGAINNSDAYAVLRDTDAFVLNSSYEGLSHVLIEALFASTAIIATKAGGNGEVVIDGENGILVPVGDTQALVSALDQMLTDDALRNAYRRAAQASSSGFSVPTMLARTASTLGSVHSRTL